MSNSTNCRLSDQAMRVEDALRKIRLLRRLVPENGASKFEAETASRLVQALMERYSIEKEDVRPVATPRSRMTWVYWEHLLAEFGHRFRSIWRAWQRLVRKRRGCRYPASSGALVCAASIVRRFEDCSSRLRPGIFA